MGRFGRGEGTVDATDMLRATAWATRRGVMSPIGAMYTAEGLNRVWGNGACCNAEGVRWAIGEAIGTVALLIAD